MAECPVGFLWAGTASATAENPRNDRSHRLVRANYMQTMMQNSSGGFLFHHPNSAYLPHRETYSDVKFAAFAIEDGPVGSNATNSPEFRVGSTRSAIVAGRTMPFSVFSMGKSTACLLKFFILYAIGIPAVAYIALKMRSGVLHKDRTMATFGVLFSSFRPGVHWW